MTLPGCFRSGYFRSAEFKCECAVCSVMIENLCLSGIVEVLLRVVGLRQSLKKSIDAERLADLLDATGVHYEGK